MIRTDVTPDITLPGYGGISRRQVGGSGVEGGLSPCAEHGQGARGGISRCRGVSFIRGCCRVDGGLPPPGCCAHLLSIPDAPHTVRDHRTDADIKELRTARGRFRSATKRVSRPARGCRNTPARGAVSSLATCRGLGRSRGWCVLSPRRHLVSHLARLCSSRGIDRVGGRIGKCCHPESERGPRVWCP